MTIRRKIKPMAIGALVASCFTIGWQEESKAAIIVLDDFNYRIPKISISADPPLVTSSTEIDISTEQPSVTKYRSQTGIMAGVLGGTRFFSLTLEKTTTENEANLKVRSPGSEIQPNKVLFWSNGDGIKSTATTKWNGGDAGLNFESSTSGLGSISALVVSADLDVQMTAEITTGFGVDEQSASLFTTVTEAIIPENGDKPTRFQFTFEDFLAENENLNLQDIDQVVFTLTGPTNANASIDSIEIQQIEIPEPSSILSILGVGFLGRFISRRKKIKMFDHRKISRQV